MLEEEMYIRSSIDGKLEQCLRDLDEANCMVLTLQQQVFKMILYYYYYYYYYLNTSLNIYNIFVYFFIHLYIFSYIYTYVYIYVYCFSPNSSVHILAFFLPFFPIIESIKFILYLLYIY